MYLDVRKEMVIIVSILFIAFFLYSFFLLCFSALPFPSGGAVEISPGGEGMVGGNRRTEDYMKQD